MIDVIDYVSSKGFQFKRSGDEIVLTCPQCGKEKLYINITNSLYHCFVCQVERPGSDFSSGHFNKLKELLGDSLPISSVAQFIDRPKNQNETNYSIKVNEYHSNLLANKQALRYLISRGLTQESIDRFNLGYAFFGVKVNEEVVEHGWISIPVYENNIPKLIKYRQLPPEDNRVEKYIRETGGKSILFNGDVIEKNEEIIIVEGEFDAITLLQNGYENVVGITGGAGTLLPVWYDKLVLKSKITLILDNDPVGQKAAREVWATRLGVGKCWNVLLPETTKDISDFFLKSTKEEFNKLLQASHQYKVDGLMSLTDALYDLYLKSKSRDTFEIFPLPWNNVNKLLGGGLSRKRLVVLGGIAGVGKTSWALQVLWHFAKVHKIPGLFFCLEMPETDLAIKVVQLNEGLTYHDINPSHALTYSNNLENVPIYFGYSSKVTPEIFYNTMKAARDRYGVEFGVFDNLQRMIRTGEESDMGKASGMFKDLVMDLNIPFILISQPRKLNSEDEPTYDDLKGSSCLSQDPDIVILLHRKRNKIGNNDVQELREDRLNPLAEVIVDKSRYAQGGFTKLKLLGAESKFVEDF